MNTFEETIEKNVRVFAKLHYNDATHCVLNHKLFRQTKRHNSQLQNLEDGYQSATSNAESVSTSWRHLEILDITKDI